MRIYAFEGITYAAGGPTERGRLAAPPYDQIDDRRAEEMHGLDPHHFTWLTRPVSGASGDQYREADHLHRRWLDEGTIRRAPTPSIYPYSIELADGNRRLGLTALVGLEEPGSGVIRPHEETLAKPLADRLALLRAMEVDLEPVLLLSEDGGELDRLLTDDLARAEEVVSHQDGAGNRHLLYRVDGSGSIERYRSCLGPAPAAIADGHHRYKVALQYAREQGVLEASSGAPDGPPRAAAAKLAVITSLHSPALEIQPIHRALKNDPGFRDAADGVASRETVEAGDGESFAAAVAAAGQPAVGIYLHGEAPEIWRLDDGAAAAKSLSPGARRLPVALLHGALLPGLGLHEGSATDGTVIYRSDPRALWRMVESGEAAIGIFLPPMEPTAFAAAIADGEMLPPKSTRFLPKVVSGMVWAGHGAKLL
jgi:uncharacterized protein (DUF1015 family)